MRTVDLLAQAGIIDDTIDLSSNHYRYVEKYSLKFSDNIKKMFESNSPLDRVISSIHDVIYRYWDIPSSTTRSKINKPAFEAMVCKYLGAECGKQYLDLLTSHIRRGIAILDNSFYRFSINNKEVVTYDTCVCMIFILMLYFTPVEQVNNLIYINDKGILDYVRSCIGFAEEDNMQVFKVGQLEYLPIEERKNIIGSIWNCIIDMISRSVSNEIVTLEGGEEDEQLRNSTSN